MPELRCAPSGRRLAIAGGSDLVDALAAAGHHLPVACGRAGTCGTCRVRLRAGAPAPTPEERRRFTPADLRAGWRLACLHVIDEGMLVEEPAAASGLAICTAIGGRLPRLAPGASGYAVAVDLGTTTLAAVLCRRDDPAPLAVASAANPQARWGDDVVSRINHATDPAVATAMGEAMRMAIDELIDEVSAAAGIDPHAIDEVACVGNTVMQHLLIGWDTQGLGQAPYRSARRTAWRGRIGARAWSTAPVIAGWVGGDILAGIDAYDLHASDATTLLLDLGTNGEMVLRHAGQTWACATAAGPAFEGARINQGMRASDGAIDAVRWTGSAFDCHIIGNGPARGICGSGLLDAVAAALEAGIVDETGALDETNEHVDEHGLRLTPQVHLSQRDLRELQLAKAAIAAGIAILCREAGCHVSDIGQVLLAGGFGSYLAPAAACRIGLLPAPITPERVTAIGNSALAGARLMALEPQRSAHRQSIADGVRYLELAGHADFQEAFVEAMEFPDEE